MNTRRQFLTGLGKIAGGVVLTQITLPLLESCAPTSAPLVPPASSSPAGADGRVAVDVSDLSDANPAKVAPGVTGPDGFGIMITRISATEFHALSMRCTHQNCPVDARLLNGDIHCNCHNSLYALNGSVIQAAGPNQPPLFSYNVVYDPSARVAHVKIV